jgi:hypothetical protein
MIGTVVADMCYEYFEQGQKMHRKFGSLIYMRNHKGGEPSAQLRMDFLPSAAWGENPNVYMIGNFIPSEKIPAAPFVCGQIYVPSDKRGERTYIGHIATRETPDGSSVQFYMQWYGVPLRSIVKGIKKMVAESVIDVLYEDDAYTAVELKEIIDEILIKKTKHALFLGIEME